MSGHGYGKGFGLYAGKPAIPDEVPASATFLVDERGLVFGDGVNITTTWPDQSGSGNDFDVFSTAKPIQRNAVINGYNVVEQVALSKLNVNSGTPRLTDAESDMWVVFRCLDWVVADNGWLFWEWSGSGPTGVTSIAGGSLGIERDGAQEYSVAGVDDQWYVYRRTITDLGSGNYTWAFYIDAVNVYNTPTVTYKADAVISGDDGGVYQDAHGVQIASIIYYPSVLSSTQAVQLGTFLENKYGVTALP